MEPLKGVKMCIIRVGGTNCDNETRRSLFDVGLNGEVLHLNRAARKGLDGYDALILPGGFSYGDYVRAGAIWARRLTSRLHRGLKRFLEDEKPIMGICNGFQVLVEAGLLPSFNGLGDLLDKGPQAALATNEPPGYRCRWVRLRIESSRCIFTHGIPEGAVLRIPVAHSEGRFAFPKEKEEEYLERLTEEGQLVLRYCLEDGIPAHGRYPYNPNGSLYDIAGICDPSGRIFGLMPHPERAYYGWQLPDWTKTGEPPPYGDGRHFFIALRSYLERSA
ncbi:MAG: phosphoribosylformylglycinamidine synthase I [Candidatus Bathyarchaeia archaeon]